MTTEVFSYPEHPLAKTYTDEEISGCKQFPLFVTPPTDNSTLLTSTEAVISYLREHRVYIFSLLKSHTVVYFRDFVSDSSTAIDFSKFLTEGLGLEPFPYTLGNAVRKSIVKDIVFTANEAPPDKLIPFHHELAQTPSYPSYVSFYCNHPSETGGETPIVNSIEVYEQLKQKIPNFIEQCEQHGVIYKRKMTEYDRQHSAIGRGWKATFQVDSKSQVENKLKQKGYQWDWEFINDVEVLTEVSPRLNAVIQLKDSNKKAFFNQMYAAWNGWVDEFNSQGDALTFGNGDKISQSDMDIVTDVLNSNQVAIPWKKGDFMIIDNLRAMHSRNSFTGKRSILASLSK